MEDEIKDQIVKSIEFCKEKNISPFETWFLIYPTGHYVVRESITGYEILKVVETDTISLKSSPDEDNARLDAL